MVGALDLQRFESMFPVSIMIIADKIPYLIIYLLSLVLLPQRPRHIAEAVS